MKKKKGIRITYLEFENGYICTFYCFGKRVEFGYGSTKRRAKMRVEEKLRREEKGLDTYVVYYRSTGDRKEPYSLFIESTELYQVPDQDLV